MDTINLVDADTLREQVRQRYSAAAAQVASGDRGCCGAECCSSDPITGNLYSSAEAGEVPAAAILASLGCGNPTALAELHPGETVLDLGSGGGMDVLLSARRVGPTGFAYGLDMTDAMLALAEQNRQEAGLNNVRFLKGYIEAIPLPNSTVDVIISNCVINLAADKGQVLGEAARVLKPGGRLAVSDIVVLGDAPPAILRSMAAWTGCIAGALRDTTYTELLAERGFTDISIEVVRRYSAPDLADSGAGEVGAADLQAADGLFASAFIRATKAGA